MGEPGAALQATGANRHRALDLRLQSLGAKGSLFERKMSMQRRQALNAKTRDAETTRRREAREAGVVLEAPKKQRPVKRRVRDRGVGGPAVGRMRMATLTLSKKDVAAIEGPKRVLKGKKGGKKSR